MEFECLANDLDRGCNIAVIFSNDRRAERRAFDGTNWLPRPRGFLLQ